MSLVFSNTTTKNGLIQQIERNCGFNDADISGNTTLLAQFTGDINSSLDYIYSKIFEVGGTWQFDDSNHTDYPIITTDLVLGQRDYSFTTDGNSNLILDVYKVFIKDSATGNYVEVYPVDVQTGAETSFTDGLNTTGLPSSYDKTATGIFFNVPPSYSATAGLKLYINREGSYFATSDTTKKAGFAGLFHEYLALRPSYMYCMRNQIKNFQVYKNEMLEMENNIMNHYKAREKDVSKQLIPVYRNTK
jgi:hypothetical protein